MMTNSNCQNHVCSPTNATVSDAMIKYRVKLGRATTYSLMGAGLYGAKGLNPIVSTQMMIMFVIPRMIYGLETQILNKKQYEMLETFYRTTLRQLQALPQNVAREAIYLLLGVLPLEAILHMRTLNLLQKIGQDETSLLYQVAVRQLAVKTAKSHSWFIYTTRLCDQYGLPHPFDIITQYKEKCEWKTVLKDKVHEYWEKKLKDLASSKSTLRYINISAMSLTKPHIVWSAALGSVQQVERAIIKARILTGTYNLHGKYIHFKDYDENPKCKLCNNDNEMREHFLIDCPAMDNTREKWWDVLGDDSMRDIQTILDHTILYDQDKNFERQTQWFCFKMHKERLRLLNILQINKPKICA